MPTVFCPYCKYEIDNSATICSNCKQNVQIVFSLLSENEKLKNLLIKSNLLNTDTENSTQPKKFISFTSIALTFIIVKLIVYHIYIKKVITIINISDVPPPNYLIISLVYMETIISILFLFLVHKKSKVKNFWVISIFIFLVPFSLLMIKPETLFIQGLFLQVIINFFFDIIVALIFLVSMDYNKSILQHTFSSKILIEYFKSKDDLKELVLKVIALLLIVIEIIKFISSLF